MKKLKHVYTIQEQDSNIHVITWEVPEAIKKGDVKINYLYKVNDYISNRFPEKDWKLVGRNEMPGESTYTFIDLNYETPVVNAPKDLEGEHIIKLKIYSQLELL